MYSTVILGLEQCLSRLGLNPLEAKVAEGQYNISKDGHTEVLLDLWEEQERVFLQVLSPVTTLRERRAEVLQMLLEENHGLVEIAFALVNDEIVLKQTMEFTTGFNEDRVLSQLSRLAHYSELYRNKWQALSQSV